MLVIILLCIKAKNLLLISLGCIVPYQTLWQTAAETMGCCNQSHQLSILLSEHTVWNRLPKKECLLQNMLLHPANINTDCVKCIMCELEWCPVLNLCVYQALKGLLLPKVPSSTKFWSPLVGIYGDETVTSITRGPWALTLCWYDGVVIKGLATLHLWCKQEALTWNHFWLKGNCLQCNLLKENWTLFHKS